MSDETSNEAAPSTSLAVQLARPLRDVLGELLSLCAVAVQGDLQTALSASTPQPTGSRLQQSAATVRRITNATISTFPTWSATEARLRDPVRGPRPIIVGSPDGRSAVLIGSVTGTDCEVLDGGGAVEARVPVSDLEDGGLTQSLEAWSVEELSKHPDAVLFTRGGELRDHLGLFTVPLLIFVGRPSPETFLDAGSGTLVKLGGRYFALTAGHVAARIAPGVEVEMPVQVTRHSFPLAELKANSVVDTNRGLDIGYIEIPAAKARAAEALSKCFASERRLAVASGAEVRRRAAWHIVSGYPAAYHRFKEGGAGLRHLYLVSTLAGTGDAPSSVLARWRGIQSFDLWVSEDSMVELTGDLGRVSLPVLRGMSGGGCWEGGVRSGDADWEPGRMKLSAVHVGSSAVEIEIGGDLHRFAREVAVGQPLRLSADDYPDLRDVILGRWPQLRLWRN